MCGVGNEGWPRSRAKSGSFQELGMGSRTGTLRLPAMWVFPADGYPQFPLLPQESKPPAPIFGVFPTSSPAPDIQTPVSHLCGHSQLLGIPSLLPFPDIRVSGSYFWGIPSLLPFPDIQTSVSHFHWHIPSSRKDQKKPLPFRSLSPQTPRIQSTRPAPKIPSHSPRTGLAPEQGLCSTFPK